ncbi:MAG: DUF3089 domain-containing protein [Robiginitomaculum sp.]
MSLSLLIIAVFWYYRDDVFQTIYDPDIPYQTYTPTLAPDYQLDSNWLAIPDKNIDPITIAGGDVFVIVPTVYLGGEHWNAPLDNPKVIENFNRIALPNYVMPYTSAGRVFAPIYRQASLYSFLTNRDDAQQAQNFAYLDVKRAFEVFLAQNPPERPIIIIGHGQGGLHAQRLLADYFQGDLRKKLAAAYIIDHPLPLDLFESDLSMLHPCADKMDIGCVIAFGAFEPKDKIQAKKFIGKTMVWENGRFQSVNGRALLCTNPLLWTVNSGYAPAKLHLGGVAAEGLDQNTIPAPSAKQTGAQCQNGILVIETPKQKSLRRPNRFGGRYRTKPSNIFYEDLRINTQRRMQTILKLGSLPKRAPLMEIETIEIKASPVTLPKQ